MRSPDRIAIVLDNLKKVWEKQPDTRFHQLVWNLQKQYQNETGKGRLRALYDTNEVGVIVYSGYYADLYNLEDKEFNSWLEDKLEKGEL